FLLVGFSGGGGGATRRRGGDDEIPRLLVELLELEIAQLEDGGLVVAFDRVLGGGRTGAARAGLHGADQHVVLALHGDRQGRGGESVGGEIAGRVAPHLRTVQAAEGAAEAADRGGVERLVAAVERPLAVH